MNDRLSANDSIKRFEPVWGQWYIKRLIGEGSYGRVYLAEREDASGVYRSAIKHIVIPKQQSDINDAKRMGMDEKSIYSYFSGLSTRLVKEINVMYSLRHEANIVEYQDHLIIHDEHTLNWDILIRMEYLTTLDDYEQVHPFSSAEVRRLGMELCTALEACAKYGVIHRDIKEGNIFVNESGRFKLGDFGIARELASGSKSMSMRGTPVYIAPEVYTGQKYDATVDVYSLGIMMYRLLNYGRYPFLPPAPAPITFGDTEAAFARRMSGEVPPAPVNGSKQLIAAVLKAMSYQAEDRYRSAAEFKKALEACHESDAVLGVPKTVFDETMAVAKGSIKTGDETVAIDRGGQTSKDAAASHAAETVSGGQTVKKAGKQKKALPIIIAITALCIIIPAVFLWGNGNSKGDADESDIPATATADGQDNGTDGIEIGEADDSSLLTDTDNHASSNTDNSKAETNTQVTEDKSTETEVENTTPAPQEQVTSLSLNKTALNLSEGDTSKLTATVSPADATDKTVKWSSSNKGVATVDSSGTVKAVAAGSATVTATASNGKKASCGITVKAEVKTITLGGKTFSPDVTKLNLSYCDISDISVLAQCKNLKELTLSYNNISDISALKNLTNLQILYIEYNVISDISALSDMKNMNVLFLSNNEINDISALSGLKNLWSLYLSNNPLSDVTALSSLSNLRNIQLKYTSLSNDQLAELQKDLPNCDIDY